MDNTLEKLRRNIDTIDEHILRLLRERMRLVGKVGKIKKRKGLPFRDEKRFQEVLDKKLAMAERLTLDTPFIKKIYTVIHSYALKVEKEA